MAVPETSASIERVFNHIFLPPQLPGRQDADLDSIGDDIVHRIQRACASLKTTTGDDLQDTWSTVEDAVSASSMANGNYRTVESLREAFKELKKEKNVLALYIEE